MSTTVGVSNNAQTRFTVLPALPAPIAVQQRCRNAVAALFVEAERGADNKQVVELLVSELVLEAGLTLV